MGLAADSSRNWGDACKSFFNRRVITLLFLGFSAGLPILLIFSSLSLWLREAGVERSAVTFFSWAALGYSFKFVWAPLVDRIPLPVLHGLLGRRRSWLLLSQASVIAALLFMAAHNPAEGLFWIASGAVMLGFSSATQDIVIDAYRIEAADDDLQAMMSSAYIAGYRVGMLVAGAGTLALASWFTMTEEGNYDYLAWAWAYRCMAVFMLIGVVTTLLVAEPDIDRTFESVHSTVDYLRFLLLFALAATVFVISFTQLADAFGALKTFLGDTGLSTPIAGFLAGAGRFASSVAAAGVTAWLLVKAHLAPREMVKETYVAPFADFFERYGKVAIYILLLVGTYRIADVVMGTISNVFYNDMGYTKEQIATITKTFGLIMTIAGGFLGGVLAIRFGVLRILWVGALLAALSNVLFAFLANLEPSSLYLSLVIAADNLSGGMSSAAFIAFLSSLTNRAFTAVQYAIFSSLMTLLPKLLAGYSGTFVDTLDYPVFFIGSALLGLPVIWLVTYVGRLLERHQAGSSH
ncbi:MFS transporter [Endozoicomonas sp. YOMI1]|uniref:AmpG family muropeptide MFS transporter n=1 Tax=Endozoicomonas sp. YOMI1 TaxID=2828739 RepID=UPI0021498048|nr:MFS transporter [Endozoicomonas sp. YOMI1]